MILGCCFVNKSGECCAGDVVDGLWGWKDELHVDEKTDEDGGGGDADVVVGWGPVVDGVEGKEDLLLVDVRHVCILFLWINICVYKYTYIFGTGVCWVWMYK